MRYSISHVAKMAGVSTRTLRHYDDIGLLHPADVSSNGYRWYGRPELRRLHRILLLRDLEVPLPQIRSILAGDDDEASVLRHHLAHVTAERDRLDKVATTIVRTLDDIEGRYRLCDEEFFQRLHEGRTEFARNLQERFGDAATSALEAAAERISGWARSDYDQAATDARDLYGRLSRARRAQVNPSSPEALDLVAEHYAAICAVWPADAAAYYALADLIETDEQQRGIVADHDSDLPPWLAEAIRVYAIQRLAYCG